MSILSWLGRSIRLTDRSFWSAFYGGETWAGEPINPETAMQIAAFWACVRLIAQTIGSLPIGMYRTQADGSRANANDNDLYKLIHDAPSADHTALEFWEGVGTCLCLAGNSFAEKTYQGTGSTGRLVAMELLNPAFVSVKRRSDGSYYYSYADPVRGARDIIEDNMFHIRGFGMGGELGFSPISFARQSLSANRATEHSAASTFANGMRPSGWIVYKGARVLTQAQREEATKNLINPMTGAGASGKTGILEGDFDYRQMTIPPEDAQLLETRAFGVEEVARVFGVPPVLIGHASAGQTMWGSGIEQMVIGWYELGLRPYLSRIEQAIKRSLISPVDRAAGIYAEFNLEGLLRADSAARGEFYWKMIQIGAMTPNEVCDKENLPRFPGGDRHYINTTLAALDDTGKIMLPLPAAAPTQPAPAAAPLRVVK